MKSVPVDKRWKMRRVGRALGRSGRLGTWRRGGRRREAAGKRDLGENGMRTRENLCASAKIGAPNKREKEGREYNNSSLSEETLSNRLRMDVELCRADVELCRETGRRQNFDRWHTFNCSGSKLWAEEGHAEITTDLSSSPPQARYFAIRDYRRHNSSPSDGIPAGTMLRKFPILSQTIVRSDYGLRRMGDEHTCIENST
ncbi:hypothetical protein B0H17DRAFT_1261998 [Mycena rosella]|uniref:Uncharacterized protein n=1 Tax=Mycena rosella TaxID=1033263 RepID=A0AAD7CT68_MYCRO|nr:hypothetical protein B0H17DRAFT_1261998 [Mycena rosella]